MRLNSHMTIGSIIQWPAVFSWAVFSSAVAMSAPSDEELLLEAAERIEAQRIAMIERVAPAVVCIFDENQMGGGTGVLIDSQGYGLTNFHVVQSMLETRKGLGGLSDGKLYELDVLGIDPGGDVAMFRLRGRDAFEYATLGDSDAVKTGDVAVAMGNPFILAEDYTPTVTWGIVSGVHRYQKGSGDTLLYSDCIQVDTPINPGNSGGPLFSAQGEVIGINGRISVSMRGRLNVGLGYAITSNQIKPFIPGLRAGLLTPHGTIQCVVQDHPVAGVICTELLEDAPAFRAGIRPGDRIVRFLNQPVTSANHYASLLGTLPANWKVPISFQKPSGEIFHRIVRTEPIKLRSADKFEPDEQVNRSQVRRVIENYRQASWSKFAPPSPSEPWSWLERHIEPQDDAIERAYKITDDGNDPLILRNAQSGEIAIVVDGDSKPRTADGQPLATDRSLVLASVYALQRRFNAAPIESDWPGVRHVGADRILLIDDEGRVSRSQLLEVLEIEIGPHQTAQFQFDAESYRLLRVVAQDRAADETATIAFEAPVDDPLLSGAWVMIRDDWNVKGDTRNSEAVNRPVDFDAPRVSDALFERVNQGVVRLFGAKAGLAKGYGSGIIVSPDGHVLTVDSIVLDSSRIRAALWDGSLVSAEVVYSDRSQQLALLKLGEVLNTLDADTNSARNYPYFDLSQQAEVRQGDWVLAGGNPFKVAAGAEPVSIALGVYGGRIKLDATRLARDFPYRGEVLIIDAITSTPGFPGGALVDLNGALLGMVGRVVQSRATNTNVNHAYPLDVLRRFYRVATDPQARVAQDAASKTRPVYHGMKFFELGYRSNPVYVERVRRGSPARKAGVRKDDLIVQANGRSVPNLETLQRIIDDCSPGDTLQLIVMRNDQVRQITIELEELKP